VSLGSTLLGGVKQDGSQNTGYDVGGRMKTPIALKSEPRTGSYLAHQLCSVQLAFEDSDFLSTKTDEGNIL